MESKEIRELAIQMANEIGLINLSRKDLCERAGIKDGSFLNIMGCSFGDLVHDIEDEVDPEAKKMPVTKRRADRDLRKEVIMDAAIEAAKEKGYREISRGDVAKIADISDGLVVYYYGSIDELRAAVLQEAIKREVVEIIAQGLVASDPVAIMAPKELKLKAVKYLTEL